MPIIRILLRNLADTFNLQMRFLPKHEPALKLKRKFDLIEQKFNRIDIGHEKVWNVLFKIDLWTFDNPTCFTQMFTKHDTIRYA